MSENQKEPMLDLAAPRVIVFTDRSRQFTLTCRRITEADWLAYFAGIVVTSERSGKEVDNVVDVDSPRLKLAEAVLEDAKGYRVSGDAELTTLPDWRKKIPLAHRLQLGATLADARVSAPTDEFLIFPEGEEVLLDASWSAHEYVDEEYNPRLGMTRFVGLKHVLKTPTEEQHRRYTSQASRARVIGGSRTGKTVYPGANALLVKLYDELVLSAEGYAVHGAPLSGRDAIVREMDTLHKVMVAQELFQPQSSVELAGGEGE